MVQICAFKEKGKEGGEGRLQLGGQWKVPSLVTFGRFRIHDQGKGLQEVEPRERPRNVGECEDEHSHSQVNSHVGSWSPIGLSNLQKVIAKVKTPHLEKFFISLKNY
jgi:hypothetical protein